MLMKLIRIIGVLLWVVAIYLTVAFLLIIVSAVNFVDLLSHPAMFVASLALAIKLEQVFFNIFYE